MNKKIIQERVEDLITDLIYEVCKEENISSSTIEYITEYCIDYNYYLQDAVDSVVSCIDHVYEEAKLSEPIYSGVEVI